MQVITIIIACVQLTAYVGILQLPNEQIAVISATLSRIIFIIIIIIIIR